MKRQRSGLTEAALIDFFVTKWSSVTRSAYRSKIYLFAFCLIALPSAGGLHGAPADRLDRKWLDSEKSLGIGSGSRSLKALPASSSEHPTEKTTKLKGRTRASEKLLQFESELRSLSEEITQLKSEIIRHSELSMARAAPAGQAEFAVLLFYSPAVRVSQLKIRLDGVELYNNEPKAASSAAPSKIPIFSGYLKQGSHQIEITANLIAAEISATTDEQSHIRSMSKDFTVRMSDSVPDNNFIRRWNISIYPTQNFSEKSRAEIQEEGAKQNINGSVE